MVDLGQVFTREDVAKYMISLFNIGINSNVLDPCFGSGNFIKQLLALGFRNIDGYEIDKILYTKNKNKFKTCNLYNQDFLSANISQKYDGIIMNPPYIRHEKIDELKAYGVSKAILRKNKIFQNLPANANIYMYFIIKAVHILKQNGELVVIFPSSWIKTKNGTEFKNLLNNYCSLINEINITGDIFEDSPMVEVIILHLRKGCSNVVPNNKKIEVKNGVLNFVNDKIENCNLKFSTPFNKIAKIRRGLTTGCNEIFINPQFQKEESMVHLCPIISSPKSISGYQTKNVLLDKVFMPNAKYKFTEEINNFIKECEKYIMSSRSPKTLYEKIKQHKKWFDIKNIDSSGILFSYFIRSDMKFIYNNEGYLARDNFYIIKPEIDSEITFALLNNYYIYYQLENIGKRYGAGLLKIQRYDFDSLRFPNFKEFSTEDILSLKKEAKMLSSENSMIAIDNITKIISKYSSTSYSKIKQLYEETKQLRLEYA